jgi:hypothetical protein
MASSCLCLFDIDRTLTGKQCSHRGQRSCDASRRCPRNKIHPGVDDTAYAGGGTLTLSTSEMTEQLKTTFCGVACHVGILTAGGASGVQGSEAALLLNVLRSLPHGDLLPANPNEAWGASWEAAHGAPKPLILHAADGEKQTFVPVVLEWYRQRGVLFNSEDVYFFDDRSSNVDGFVGTGFNARQVSCNTRDGNVGFCGATPSEITAEKGVKLCGAPVIPLPHKPPPPSPVPVVQPSSPPVLPPVLPPPPFPSVPLPSAYPTLPHSQTTHTRPVPSPTQPINPAPRSPVLLPLPSTPSPRPLVGPRPPPPFAKVPIAVTAVPMGAMASLTVGGMLGALALLACRQVGRRTTTQHQRVAQQNEEVKAAEDGKSLILQYKDRGTTAVTTSKQSRTQGKRKSKRKSTSRQINRARKGISPTAEGSVDASDVVSSLINADSTWGRNA